GGFARWGQPVFMAQAVRAGSFLDNSLLFQLPQPFDKQCARHQWHAAVDIIEAMGAEQQLAYDERCPSRGEDFGRLGHRTELAVAGFHVGDVHGSSRRRHLLRDDSSTFAACAPVQKLNLTDVRPARNVGRQVGVVRAAQVAPAAAPKRRIASNWSGALPWPTLHLSMFRAAAPSRLGLPAPRLWPRRFPAPRK